MHPILIVCGDENMNEEEVPYKCGCGGNLKKTKVEVEFFGIDFGLRDAEVCTACGAEYLNQETLKEIEEEIKDQKIFAIEKNGTMSICALFFPASLLSSSIYRNSHVPSLLIAFVCIFSSPSSWESLCIQAH